MPSTILWVGNTEVSQTDWVSPLTELMFCCQCPGSPHSDFPDPCSHSRLHCPFRAAPQDHQHGWILIFSSNHHYLLPYLCVKNISGSYWTCRLTNFNSLNSNKCIFPPSYLFIISLFTCFFLGMFHMILPSSSPAGLHYGYPLTFLLKELNGFS